MPITALDGPCIVNLQQGRTALALVAGLWQPQGQLDLQGVQDSFTGGQDYTIQVDVITGLTDVQCAVAQVALSSVSNRKTAINAAWRILNYDTQPNTPAPGTVRIVATVEVSDSDGYLEGLSFSVEAVGAPTDEVIVGPIRRGSIESPTFSDVEPGRPQR